MHLVDLMSARAGLTPQREALLELATGRRFTYGELNARANRLANFLQAGLGVKKGDRVSILAHNSVVDIDLFYAVAKLGAITAPLNWRLSARELAYIVNDCQPTALICGPEFSGLLAELCPQIDVPHVIGIEGAPLKDAWSYDEATAAASSAEPAQPPLAAEDTYAILYTSGTTGKPKGAMIPHRQVLWNCINTVISWGLGERDVSPVTTPLFHAGGLFAFLTPILYAGGRIVLARDFDPEASLRALVDERCTVILGVPTLFQLWMNAPGYAAADFSHVHFFISGGAPCPPALMQAWRTDKGVVFRQGYGLTEVGPNCFSMTDEESVLKTGSVGKPIFHSRMRLVDPQTGRDVATGEAGELLIAGPHVCTGYWRNPAAGAAALREGWFHTGDSARRDEDGFYTIVGRYKDMIKSGGENIYAAEVEAVFREHPAVADAALIGQPDAQWGETGLLIVVLKPGHEAGEESLLDFCRGRLARYKVPRRVLFSDSLPYSPYGKVIKAELRQRFVGE